MKEKTENLHRHYTNIIKGLEYIKRESEQAHDEFLTIQHLGDVSDVDFHTQRFATDSLYNFLATRFYMIYDDEIIKQFITVIYRLIDAEVITINLTIANHVDRLVWNGGNPQDCVRLFRYLYNRLLPKAEGVSMLNYSKIINSLFLIDDIDWYRSLRNHNCLKIPAAYRQILAFLL
jgi:hypothetical protein